MAGEADLAKGDGARFDRDTDTTPEGEVTR